MFEAALDLPEDARASYLDEACRNRPGEFKAGDVLSQRFRIERLIARGGMGAVYRAIDLDLDVALALKTIRPEIASEPDTLRRFKREVLLARSISHPNVCRIYDSGRDPDRDITFLTMEYLPGETLETRIRRDGPLAPGLALLLLEQITDALDAAHKAGVIHRDLKSGNIMLVPSEEGERAVLTDFGIACALTSDARDVPVGGPRQEYASGDETPGGSQARDFEHHSAWLRETGHFGAVTFRNLIGTAAYMAPEQVRGVVSTSSDLYALGVVLFEMTAGRLPFVESSALVTALARLERLPPAPSEVGSVVPEWDAVIMRLLAIDPAERYGTAREVFSALLEASPELRRRPGGPQTSGITIRNAGAVQGWKSPAADRASAAPSIPAERDAFV
jgi:serine/threonine protein kinase